MSSGGVARSVKGGLHYVLARYRSRRRHWVRAARHYKGALRAWPDSTVLYYRLGYALLRRKRYTAALEEFDKARELGYDAPYYWIRRAQCLARVDRLDEALSSARKVVDDFPERYIPNRVMGDLLIEAEDYERAAEYHDKALAAALRMNDRDKISYSYHALGSINEMSGNLAEAKELYAKAISNDDRFDSRNLGIGVFHQSSRLYDLALKAYQHEVDSGNSNAAEIYYRIGVVYSRMSRYAESAEAFSKFVELDEELAAEGHRLDDKMVIFESYMGRGYACSPRAIYEEMLKDPKFNDYKFVWAFRRPGRFKYLESDRTRLVKYRSRNYLRFYSRSKYWFTNSRLPYVEKTNDRQVYIQCWHGTPLKRLGHDIIEDNDHAKFSKEEFSDLYDSETAKLDYFLSPSRYATERFKAAFNLGGFNKEDAILEEGYPRNDYLKNYKEADVHRVKKELGVDPSKKVLLYAPTWRDNSYESGTGYTYKTEADFEYLQKHLGDDWVILFRAHYFIANSFDFGKYGDFVVDVSKVNDVNDLYIVSDALMTDYSSVFFDYANLGRPMLFFMYDLEMYMNNLRGFYIDLDELPGDIVKDEAAIVGILNDLDQYIDKHKKQYDIFNKKFNYLDDGRASKRVIDRIIEI